MQLLLDAAMSHNTLLYMSCVAGKKTRLQQSNLEWELSTRAKLLRPAPLVASRSWMNQTKYSERRSCDVL